MNCAECRDNLVACAEGLLSREESLQCHEHLEACAECRNEYRSITHLQQRLIVRGQAAAEVSVVEPVMQRIRRENVRPERINIMSLLLKNRWRFGLSAAVGAAALVLVFTLNSPNARAAATQALAKGAEAVAKLTSVHIRCQMRSAPRDNFEAISPDSDFITIDVWKQFSPELKWRVEKSGRVALMDGKTTLMWDRSANWAWKFDRPASSAFDTECFQQLADLSGTLNRELQSVQAHNWPVTVERQTGTDGRAKTVITVAAKSSLPDSDYLKNKFFATADTRRVYVFDEEKELLQGVKVYLHRSSGDVLVLEVTQIEYNADFDPGVFALQLPGDVNWYQRPQVLADNEKYSSLTPEQATRAFFEACGRGDWTEAGKFTGFPINDQIKQYLSGVTLVTVGTPFGTALNPHDQFVPYEIKLKNGYTKKLNLALRKEPPANRWLVNGGL